MMQMYSSRETSINKTKLPAIFKKAFKKPSLYYEARVLDYGCGKYTDHIKAFFADNSADFKVEYLPYDPFNQPLEVNAKTLRQLKEHPADIAVCSNVLNVINDDAVVQHVIDRLFELTDDWGTIYITAYEGDKTGIGRETKKDCWQRNERLKAYLRFLKGKSILTPTIKHGMLIIEKTPNLYK